MGAAAAVPARVAGRRRHSLLAALFLVMIVAVFAVHAALLVRHESQLIRRMLEEQAVAQTSDIASSITSELEQQDYGAFKDMLLQVQAWSGVQALSVIDANGRTLSAVRRSADGRFSIETVDARQAPPARSEKQIIEVPAGRVASAVLIAWSPIGASTARGWVRAEVSMAPLRELRWRIIRNSMALGSMSLALAAAALAALLKPPLSALKEAADFAEHLDTRFGRVLPTEGCSRQVGQLRNALNRTSLRLFDQHAALVESESRYRSVVENLDEIVFGIDPRTCYTHLNRTWETITRYSVRESLGRQLGEFVMPEDRDKLQRALAPVIAGDADTAGFVARFRAKNGEVRWLETSFRANRDADGQLAGLAGSATDITDRKHAEEKLRDQLRFVHQLIEAIPNPIYIKNTDGRYLGFNKAFARFFGRRRRNFLGKTVFHLLPREEAEWHHARDAALLAHPGVQTYEARIVDRSGQEHDTIYHKATFTKAGGSVAGIVGIITDISERKLFERELLAAKDAAEAASRAKNDFLANISHEIRTPMNAIIGMTELVLDTPIDDEQREYLGLVKDSADSLLAIINDILDFSKIDAGRLDFENIPFSLRDCIQTAVRATANGAGVKSLALQWSVADDVFDDLIGDPHRLRQVLTNLLDNAVKFTEKGEIGVSVALIEQSSDWLGLQFSVHDTGPGIAPHQQREIFDAFSQANGSATRTHGGTGLGLAICSRLIRAMDGKLWVDSSPGAGSTFHFTARLGVSKPLAAMVPDWPHAVDVRALIISDNAGSRRQLENLLASWKFSVRAAGEGADGVSALVDNAHTQPPNVILLEHAGSDGDEFTTAAALRSHAPDAQIIVLTAAGLRGDAARCREHGISGYLAHPVPDSDLREAILLSLETPHIPGDATLITRHTLRERRHHLRQLQAQKGAADRKRAAALSGAIDAQSAQAELAASLPRTAEIFDRSALLQNLGGDSEIFEAIAATFLAGYADSLDRLQQALAADDFDGAYRAAHSIKGAAGSFSAQPVVRAALDVEACARQCDASALHDAAEILVQQMKTLAAALQRELSSNLTIA